MFNPQTFFLAAGLLYTALPLIAWTILHSRHDRKSVWLWCGGGLLLGISFLLISLRGARLEPSWLVGAGLLAFASYLLRHLALRRELGRRSHLFAALLLWAALSLAYTLAVTFSAMDAPRMLVAQSGHAAGSAVLAWSSWCLYRQKGYRTAAMLAGAYGLFCAAMLLRIAALPATWEIASMMRPSLDFALASLAALLAGLYANLGYIGIALEGAQAKAVQRATELAREQERRAQTELHVAEQRALVAERDQMLARREEMLTALAHEVRQPLNNASAALQSAAEGLTDDDSDRLRAAQRLQRANTVLMQVTAALDNTLTDAVLLGGSEAISLQDTDIDMLVSLAIADINPAARERVQRERTTPTRTASMNPGLMRLALRNLIINALTYSPADRPVVVRIADSDDPLALLIDVSDAGQGIAADLLPRLFTRGVRGANAHHGLGHGLGLSIVRRVMEMHGGEVRVEQNSARGLTMRLVIPQA